MKGNERIEGEGYQKFIVWKEKFVTSNKVEFLNY